jgi:hypothetical protein
MNRSTVNRLRKIAESKDNGFVNFLKNAFRLNPTSNSSGPTVDPSGGAVPPGVTSDSTLSTGSFKHHSGNKIVTKPDNRMSAKDAYMFEYGLVNPYRFNGIPENISGGEYEYVEAMKARAKALGVPYIRGAFYPVQPLKPAGRRYKYNSPVDFDVDVYYNAPLKNGAVGEYSPGYLYGSPNKIRLATNTSDEDFISSKAHETAHAATPLSSEISIPYFPDYGSVNAADIPGFYSEYETSTVELLGQMHSLKALYSRLYREPAPKNFRAAISRMVSDGYLNSRFNGWAYGDSPARWIKGASAPNSKFTDDTYRLALPIVGPNYPTISPAAQNPKLSLPIDQYLNFTHPYLNAAPLMHYILRHPASQETDDGLDYYWQQSNNGRINKRVSDTA